ncbi:hypothetical protein CONPUDRAFT_165920 [Coniophora puteana RWD-64-598 SS2]|uniref:Uncharacterized protein n=1 Tax=Coniophora puteana (strain RWD-64-598) TaxID=741705 RepID=A0A5M3MNS6_CONPW|nr:uncharacterized protein CONPUDRAFT_165920 [Coniophora puteana RWD-64-598 SS2]EIW80385.1 hypothetical protein CONPUDRAFT_165920 [Coniophora puteana RWD-64-598 SS2]
MSTTTARRRSAPENTGSSTQSLTSRQEPTSVRDGQSSLGFKGDIPPQRHAGKLDGPGPESKKGIDFGDKFAGFQEEIKGKLLRKPDVAKHGHDMRTGELKRREQEEALNVDPYSPASNDIGGGSGPNAGHGAPAADEHPQARPNSSNFLSGDHQMQRAATISPQGSESAEFQRQGGNVERAKMIG